MEKHKLSFPVTFEKVDEIKSDDTRFTRLKCFLMHTNENLNHSSFSKEVIENAIPTLSYIPVVGFIENNELDEKDFSDHRYIITKDNGKVKRVYKGSAYGVVLSSEDNNAHFETKICEDGIEREFLVADAIAWNFLEDSSQILNRDLVKDHSIELDENSVDGFEDENGIFHFTRFSFRAACVLGGIYEPAMTGSTVEVQFSVSDFVKTIQNELNYKLNKFTTFTKLVKEKSEQGGTKTMQDTDFTQTALQQFGDISNIVSQHELMKDRFGDEYPRFYAVDIQDNEVIIVDRNDNYNYYGFAFTLEGDKPVIDFACGKRKKVRYENYEDGSSNLEGSFNFGKHIAEIEEAAFTRVNDANAKADAAEQASVNAETNYSQIKADYDEMKPKYDEYVQAEEKRQNDEINAQKDAKFAEYEDSLAENADFVALKERKDELSVDEIEKECAVLYVKANRSKAIFSKVGVNAATVDVIGDDDINNCFITTKYGTIPIRH